MSDAVMPKIGLQAFNCVRCGVLTHHAWSDLRVRVLSPNGGPFFTKFWDGANSFRVTDEDIRELQLGQGDEWSLSVCFNCGAGTVWRGTSIVWPGESSLPMPHPDMPESARELYDEARAVFPHSRRASAALARAALERLLRDQEGADPNGRLIDLIGQLQGKVRSSLWKVLTVLRHLGNTTLHGSDPDGVVALYMEGDAAEVAEPYFTAMNMLVEELITQEGEADELYAMLPASVRDSAERNAEQQGGK